MVASPSPSLRSIYVACLNYLYNVIDITDKKIEMQRYSSVDGKNGEIINIPIEKFNEHYIANWITTVNRCEGQTWNFEYTIYEAEKLYNYGRLHNGLYTALTRSSKEEYINIAF